MRILRQAIAASAVLVLGLSACSTSSAGGPSAPNSKAPASKQASPQSSTPSGDVPKGDGTKTIYLVSQGFQHRYWQAVKEGAEQAGKEFGYKIAFVGPDDETKVTQQLDQLKTALDSRPAAIGFAALDSGAAEPVLQEIAAAKIPVIAFDSAVDSAVPVTTVQTDNYAAAEAAAEHLTELIGGKGTVGLVCHDQTSQSAKDRCRGFQDWMKDNAPEVKVLQQQYAGEVGLAANAAKSIVQANPDVVGMYGTNEAAAGGVVQGVKEAGNADVTVVGFDSGKTQLDAIRDGSEAGAITQAPVKMGYETVIAAIRAIDGQTLPEVIDSGFEWYDATNLDDPAIAANLYE